MGKVGEKCCCCCYSYDPRAGIRPSIVTSESVKLSTSTMQGPRTGKKLCTYQWTPVNQPIVGTVYWCHGYGDHSFFNQGEVPNRLAENGYLVFSIDYPGHGQSEGVHGLVQDLTVIAAEVTDYYKTLRVQHKDKAALLFGFSMGGAVASIIAGQNPTLFDGVILGAPMIKIAPERYPPACVIKMLTWVATCFPTWPVVPSEDLNALVATDPTFREKLKEDKFLYDGNPRVRSGLSLLYGTNQAQEHAEKITAPLYILHGSGDVITACEASQEFGKKVKSQDVTVNIYEGMCHALMNGDENKQKVQKVWDDLLQWMQTHSTISQREENETPVNSPLTGQVMT